MLSALQKDDPATYRKIEAEAAATPNGKGLLWKLEKPGEKPSFLFGTMHMTDPRVTTLPPAAQKAYDAADTVIIETTDVLDKQKMMAAMLKEPDLMMFTDNTTLSSLLSPDDAAAVNKALDARGIPPASVAKMKPWMLSAMVALPACELARQAGGAPVLDVKLARGRQGRRQGRRRAGNGRRPAARHGLAAARLSHEGAGRHAEARRQGQRRQRNHDRALPARRHRHVLAAVPRRPSRTSEDDPAGYAAFEETMITSRNKVMVDHAEPILAKGNAFMAVGALHLPGPEGLVEDFRKAGYTVTAVNLQTARRV